MVSFYLARVFLEFDCHLMFLDLDLLVTQNADLG
jgi:hypothetical protein